MRRGLSRTTLLVLAAWPAIATGCGSSPPPPDTFVLALGSSGGGTIVSVPPGIACAAACTGATAAFPRATAITLTAAPEAGARFVGWAGACTGAGPCVLMLDADRNVTATFATSAPALTVSRLGSGGGTVASAPAGIACGDGCTATFPFATSVTLTATADVGSSFTGWLGDCVGTVACTLTLDRARTATATFTRTIHVLTVRAAGDGAVTSSPGGIFCGGLCAATFPAGTAVTLTPAAGSGSFLGWSGACTGSDACVVTLASDQNVLATFTVPLFVERSGHGRITGSAGGLDCGEVCAANLPPGAAVTLTATPDPGASFAGWSGACSGTETCSVTPAAATRVGGRFSGPFHALTLEVSGAGKVTAAAQGIECRGACATRFDAGTALTLLAVPDAGAVFTGWSGGCAGTGACVLTLDADRAVSATFAPATTFPLTVTRAGPGAVVSNPFGVYCGGACEARFAGGTVVTLLAYPDGPGIRFAGWSGGCAGTGSCTVTMSAARAVSAEFFPRGRHRWSRTGDVSVGLESRKVVADAAGDLLLAGRFFGTADFGCGPLAAGGDGSIQYVAKIRASDGSCAWSRTFTSPQGIVIAALAVGASGDVVLGGLFRGSADLGCGEHTTDGPFGYGLFAASLRASDGQCRWSKGYRVLPPPGQTQPSLSFTALGTGVDGNAIVSGAVAGSLDLGCGIVTSQPGQLGEHVSFVGQLRASDGACVWSRRFKGTALDPNLGYSHQAEVIAADGVGNPVVAGGLIGSIDFGCGALSGTDALFVAKLSVVDGACVRSRRYQGTAPVVPISLRVDAAGDEVLVGTTEAAIELGCGPLRPVTGGGYSMPAPFFARFRGADAACAGARLYQAAPLADINAELTVTAAGAGASGNLVFAGGLYGRIDFGCGVHVGGAARRDPFDPHAVYPALWVAMTSPDATCLWSRVFDVPFGTTLRALGAGVDASDDAVLAGDLNGGVDFGGGPRVGTQDFFFVSLYP